MRVAVHACLEKARSAWGRRRPAKDVGDAAVSCWGFPRRGRVERRGWTPMLVLLLTAATFAYAAHAGWKPTKPLCRAPARA